MNDLKEKTQIYMVTGISHGSIVYAKSVNQAREMFKKTYENEEILHVKLFQGRISNL